MTALTEIQAHEAIANRWKTEWTSLYPNVKFKFENEQFKEPPTEPWAEVEVIPIESIQETIGPPGERQYLRTASIWVRLHVPRNSGTELLRDMVDKVRAIYEGAAYGGISPALNLAARTQNVTGQKDSRWYSKDVIIPIQYTEIR